MLFCDAHCSDGPVRDKDLRSSEIALSMPDHPGQGNKVPTRHSSLLRCGWQHRPCLWSYLESRNLKKGKSYLSNAQKQQGIVKGEREAWGKTPGVIWIGCKYFRGVRSMNRKLRPFLEPFKSNFPLVKASKYTYFKFCVHCFSALMFEYTHRSPGTSGVILPAWKSIPVIGLKSSWLCSSLT